MRRILNEVPSAAAPSIEGGLGLRVLVGLRLHRGRLHGGLTAFAPDLSGVAGFGLIGVPAFDALIRGLELAGGDGRAVGADLARQPAARITRDGGDFSGSGTEPEPGQRDGGVLRR